MLTKGRLGHMQRSEEDRRVDARSSLLYFSDLTMTGLTSSSCIEFDPLTDERGMPTLQKGSKTICSTST
jgi:hypothetical protein